MLHYVARRLVAAVPTLLGVSVVVFMMVRLLPGDPARIVAGLLASDTDVEAIRRAYEYAAEAHAGSVLTFDEQLAREAARRGLGVGS